MNLFLYYDLQDGNIHSLDLSACVRSSSMLNYCFLLQIKMQMQYSIEKVDLFYSFPASFLKFGLDDIISTIENEI